MTSDEPPAEPAPEDVVFQTSHVAGSVFLLQGGGGGVAVSAGADGIAMIDTDYAEAHPRLMDGLAALGIADRPVRFVCNTHHHLDHVGGNGAFVDRGAILIAHANVAPRLAAGYRVNVGPYPQVLAPVAPAHLPRLAFDRELALTFNGETIAVRHFPAAHTDNDVAVFFERSNVVHMGDLFVRYGFPFIDVDAGGRIDGMIAACEAVMGMVAPDVAIVVGHGEVAGLGDLADYVAMLKGTRAAVLAALRAGRTSQAMKRDRVMAPWAERYDNPFIDQNSFIDTLVRSFEASGTSGGGALGS